MTTDDIPESDPAEVLATALVQAVNDRETRRRASVPRLAYSPAEAAEALGVTRQTIYNLIARGQLRRFHVGTCARIPAADVHALVGFEG